MLLLLLEELEEDEEREELPELLDDERDDERDELLSDELKYRIVCVNYLDIYSYLCLWFYCIPVLSRKL